MEDVASLKAIIVQLLEKIAILEARLEKYEHPKNSRNSSIPPSKDENRVLPNQSLRTKSGKKVGGQQGHKGHTLEFSSSPTEIIPLKVNFCLKCGNNLQEAHHSKVESRQVIEIPPIVPIVKEFQRFNTICTCGYCNKAAFPQGVEAPVQYGSSVESMVVYLNSRQYMPFARMQEYFKTVFQLPLSQGTIQNILTRMVKRVVPFYELIKEGIQTATCVGGDETSVRINGEKGWFWTLQTKSLTFIHCSDNRGSATLDYLFPNGLPHSVLVHDAYAAWIKFVGNQHQLCLAHLLRNLNYFEELYANCHWVVQVKNLFKQAIDWKNNPTANPPNFEAELDMLLAKPPDSNFPTIQPFVKRLVKNRKSLFVFLNHLDVPADNNASERAIRNAKVKTKISGQFLDLINAQMFAIFRSIIDTLIKNNQPILPALQILANSRPE